MQKQLNQQVIVLISNVIDFEIFFNLRVYIFATLPRTLPINDFTFIVIRLKTQQLHDKQMPMKINLYDYLTREQ